MDKVLAVLLAGGMGERLHPLTRHRAKPAVPFGGMYRIIDFTLSNCINSGCRRIQILVQYKSHSLARHVRVAWDIMHRELGETIDIIPPQMRVNNNWYLGTADAVYQNLYSIDYEDPREVLLLSGDHIYKMDYHKMVMSHRQLEADLTIAAIEMPLSEARQFGVFEVDRIGRIVGFQEKPDNPKPLPDQPDMCLASMGIYVFNKDVLKRALIDDSERNSNHDFGKDIIPRLINTHNVYTYKFQDENKKQARYWRDVGTIDAYWEANIDLVEVDPQFNLYDKSWPLRNYLPMLPPAKFVFANPNDRFGCALDSIVSPGCIVSGGMVWRSILSPEVRVNSFSHVEECVLFKGVSIGRRSRIRRAIIEKNIQIPEGSVIGYDLEHDARYHRVTPNGVVVVENVPQESLSKV